VARASTVHLAPLPGTNVALMNGFLYEIIRNDRVDHDYVDAHTVRYDEHLMQIMRNVEQGYLSDKAVEPPGQAQPLPQWHDSESEVLSPQVLAS